MPKKCASWGRVMKIIPTEKKKMKKRGMGLGNGGDVSHVQKMASRQKSKTRTPSHIETPTRARAQYTNHGINAYQRS